MQHSVRITQPTTRGVNLDVTVDTLPEPASILKLGGALLFLAIQQSKKPSRFRAVG